jgi:hypothetical protein
MMPALRIESIVLDDIKECAARFQAGPDDDERPNGSGLHLSFSTHSVGRRIMRRLDAINGLPNSDSRVHGF